MLVTGRTKATLDAVREELGKNAIVINSDAASLSDIDKLAERAKSEFGTVDLLFVNAGLTRFVPFENMTEAVYDELLTINAKGAYFTVQKRPRAYVACRLCIWGKLSAKCKTCVPSNTVAARQDTESAATEINTEEVRPTPKRRSARADGATNKLSINARTSGISTARAHVEQCQGDSHPDDADATIA